MARPRSFDLDTATDAAMHLFWRDGYDGAGLADLLDAMQIGRGSLYKAFGSKRGLFLAALERYAALHVTPGLTYLRSGDGAGADRIASVMANSPYNNRGKGCLLCNTAAGPAADDPEIRNAVNEQLDRIRDAFAVALSDDGPSGPTDPEIASRADRLAREYVGLQIGARSGWRIAARQADG